MLNRNCYGDKFAWILQDLQHSPFQLSCLTKLKQSIKDNMAVSISIFTITILFHKFSLFKKKS